MSQPTVDIKGKEIELIELHRMKSALWHKKKRLQQSDSSKEVHCPEIERELHIVEDTHEKLEEILDEFKDEHGEYKYWQMVI